MTIRIATVDPPSVSRISDSVVKPKVSSIQDQVRNVIAILKTYGPVARTFEDVTSVMKPPTKCRDMTDQHFRAEFVR
eukprot:11488004-Ditylum_brightwellii.AAC.1